jgi:formylglycine-generating enzyme required for sulfatase activity
MGKYPVTNAQFRRFVEAGGYDEDRPWWTEEAVKDIERWSFNEGWRNGPRLWGNPRFDRGTQPVVGVSWYEAGAYCQWLSEVWRSEGVIAAEEMVRLPTEAEWQAAAGEDEYTWGDEFNPAYCNSKESEFDQPSPVHMHPAGATPSGIHDLNGNVWEWSLDDHEDWGKVLRGGAWYEGASGVTSAARHWSPPFGWSYYLGFRVVVVPSSR